MSIRFSWELEFSMPGWVEKIHDFVWEPEEDEDGETE